MRKTARAEKLILITLPLIVAGCFAAMIALSLGGCAEESEDPIPQENSDSDYVPAVDPTGSTASALTEDVSASASTAFTYDRSKAREYAIRYGWVPNPAVAYCGSWILENSKPVFERADCTDFASQVLHAGGMPMNFSHYGDGWWYSGSCDWWGSSDSWRTVNGLITYLTSISQRGEFRTRARDLQLGDLIFYRLRREDNGYSCGGSSLFNHTAVVMGFDRNGEPLVAYHSNDAENVLWNVKTGTRKALGEACAVVFVHIKG